MKLKILKNKEIIFDKKIKEFHNKNNLFAQQDPYYCYYNEFENSKNLIFQLFDNKELIAYASLSHYTNNQINILTNVPSISSHSSFCLDKNLGDNKKKIFKKLYFEIEKYCYDQKINLLSFATDPITDNINEINKIVKPELKFRNFTQILNLNQIKLNTKSNDLEVTYEKLNTNNLNQFYKDYLKLFKFKNYKTLSYENFKFLKHLNSKIYYIYKNNNLLNSTIIIENNKILVEYFLSLNFSTKFRANTMLVNFLLKKYKELNFKYFNFQSSKKINDGTFVFKKKFNPEIKYFFYLTKIFISKNEFTNKFHLYKVNDGRFIYPIHFNSLKNFEISYIK